MKKLNNPTENFVSRRINQRRVRRWVALLSALVLFLTVNTLKLEADTLERIATCGIEQHVHDESCYDASGALTCGLAEHAHTDACFQQRPQRHDLTRVDGFMPLNAKVTLATPMPKLTSNSADGQDAVQAEADYYSDIPTEVGSGIEPPVDEIETELAGEDAAPAVEDAVPLEIVYEDQAEETVQQPEYVINGSTVLLSDILSVLGMKASGIQTVGELEGDTFAEDPVNFAVEATQNDYELRVLRDFDAAELGVVTADEVIVITLKNGIAPVEDSDDENPSENDDINIEETHTEETDEEVAADETVDEEAEDSADELTENADDEETGEASDEATVDETEEEAVETVEETETAAVTPEKQIALDFADYDCLADATVYFYASDRAAVLVNAEELAEADGVHLTVNAPVVLSMEANLGLAELEAALEEAPEDIDARIGENPVLFENGVLIISGDGELTVNGVTYTVTNLTLPARSVESDNITISTVDDQATLLGVTPAFEDNGEDEGDIYALFAARMDEHIVTATSEEIQIDAIKPAKGLLRSSAMMATTDAAPEAEEAVADAEETAGTETTEAAVETRTLRVRVYDVSLIREGESVEPDAPIHVETTFDAPLEGENFQLYHIVDGKPEAVDGFVKTDDQGRAIGMSFDTASLSPFAVVYYTVEYTTDNNEVTVKLDFTDIVQNGVDFDTNSVITALNDGVSVSISELEQGYIEGTDSVVNGELYIDYTTADNKNENIKNVNWIGFKTIECSDGLNVVDGKIKVTKDGTVVLSDGISTVTVVISNYEKLVAKELTSQGVDITVLNGEVPAGSEVSYTALDEAKTSELVEQYNIDSDVEGVAHTAFDVSIAMPEGGNYAESGEFAVAVDLPVDEKAGDFKLYHIHEGQVEELPVEVVDGKVLFTTSSFSEFVLSYTVDFEYNGYQFSMPGGGVLLLSELFEQLHIEEDVADVVDVTFTDYDLLKVEHTQNGAEIKVRKPVSDEITMDDVLALEGDTVISRAAEYESRHIPAGEWILTSLKPFNTHEELNIRMKKGDIYLVYVTDAYNGTAGNVRLQDVVTDGDGNTTKAISIKITEGGNISDMSRTADLTMRLSYVLTATNLEKMQSYASRNGSIPVITYDFSSTLSNTALANSLQGETISLTDEGKSVGTLTISPSGVITIELTDKDWFAERTQLGGYVDLHLHVDSTQVPSEGEEQWVFPGAPTIGPVHYKDVLSNGGKNCNAKKLKDDNGKDYYLLDYSVTINVNSDVTNVTFEDRLSTDGVAGGIQEVVWGSAKLDGESITSANWIDKDPRKGFTTTFASLSAGQHTVTYQVKIAADQLDGMAEGDKKDAVNKAVWKLSGDKEVPGGETHYQIEKPYREVEVHKTAPETADPEGVVNYSITFGDSQTPLANLIIKDSITDIQKLQGQIKIKVPGRSDIYINGSNESLDDNYSTNMNQLFWYQFEQNDTGYGPVTVEYTTKVIDEVTARKNGIFDAVNAINTASEERTYKSDSTTTVVEFPRSPKIDVKKTASVSDEDVDEDGNWKPDATVSYTITIGEPGENLSDININDQMSSLQGLIGDISVSVNGSTDSSVATAFKNALESSRNGATTGTLFNFTMPEGTIAPIVITYTTHLKSVAEAKAAQVYGTQYASNTINVGGKPDTEGSDVTYPDEYELEKRVTADEKNSTTGTQTYHWTVEYGDGTTNDMGGARIYDEMTKAQKLVAGSVKVTLSSALDEAIEWPDGTVWAAGSTGPFDMPQATDKTATDGVIWTKYYSTDTNYSLNEMVPVFNLKLPDSIGTVKVTVNYDTEAISDKEALKASVAGLTSIYNHATVGHSSVLVPVEHDFPTPTEHHPDGKKSFLRWDEEHRKVYWTIEVYAKDGSGYPLENVTVVEELGAFGYENKGQGVNDYKPKAEDFDLSSISVQTASGVTLEPGVEYTVDYSPESWTYDVQGRPSIHFPEINEKVIITIAYSTGDNDILDGFKAGNKANIYKQGSTKTTVEATKTKDLSEKIDLAKNGDYDQKDRLAKWIVRINPLQKNYENGTSIRFIDDLPAGMELVNYDVANAAYANASVKYDHSQDSATPSIYVNWAGIGANHTFELTNAQYKDGKIDLDIAPYAEYGNLAVENKYKLNYEVTYYTWVSDELWSEITSSLSGSKIVANTVEIEDTGTSIGDATGTTTVTSEEFITKYDITTVKTVNGKEIVYNNTTDVPSNTLTYQVDINPNCEQLTAEGKKLSVTDTINTKMELDTGSLKFYYYDGDTRTQVTLPTESDSIFKDLTLSYNDDTRTMVIGGIPDKTHCVLEYDVTARAMGTQTYTNTATLVGGGSHSSTVTEDHTVQYANAGMTSRTTSLKLKKFDENNVTRTIAGATFELYECTLAGGLLADWTTERDNPDPSTDGDDTKITVFDVDKINAAIAAGPGSAQYEKLIADFTIESSAKPVISSGNTLTTGTDGIITFKPVYENKLYFWKETATSSEYDAEEIGIPHYFVLYSEKKQNTLGETYNAEELARRRAEAKALDDAASLANGLTIACMVSDNGTTWNVNNIEKGYTSISATKEWKGDSNNFFKNRPTDGILLDLYKVYPDGSKVLVEDKSPVPMNVDKKTGVWPTVSWTKLPKSETLPSGQVVALKYTVVERPVPNYTTEYSDNNEGVTSGQLTVTNTLIPVNTRISVKKVFDKNITNLPDQIVVKLWQICTDKNGVVTRRYYDEDMLSAANNWQYTWKALPTRDDDGNSFTYTVEEDVDALEAAGFHFTAMYSDDGEGVSSADVDDPLIIRNIDNGLRIVKTLAGDGSKLTESMKQQIRLIVEKVGGTSTERTEFTLADMTVGEDGKLEKILAVKDYGWIDDGALNVTEINPNFKHFGVRSVSYTINGGTATEVTDDLGRVVMQNVSLQEGKSGLLEITNDYEEEKTELPVRKVWQNVEGTDITWPTDIPSVTVDLMKVVNGEAVEVGESLTLDSSRTSGLFANLPKYEFNTDRLIEYTVRESVRGYTTTVTDQEIDEKPGKRITNRKDQPKLFVEKVWDGATSFIPSSIKVQLYESATEINVSDPGWTAVGAPVTITAADNWKTAFENLTEGKYYKVEEVGNVSGWNLVTYSDENGSAFHDLETITITNKRTPPPPSDEEITVGVQKIWTEDGKPVDAPVDDVKVKLVRYKAKPATESAILHLYYWLSNNGPIHITDLEVEKGESVSYGVTYSAKDMGGWSWTPNPTWYKVAPETFRTLDRNSYIPNIGNSITTTSFAVSDDELYLIAHENSQNYDTGSSRLFTITNHSPVEESTGEEIWFGPEDYTYPNTESSSAYDAATKKLTLRADNGWQYEFVKLPKKGTEDGTKYIYRYAVVEDTVSGFTTSYTYENGERINLSPSGTATALGTDGVAKVTNNRETTKITAKKKWGTNVWPGNVTAVGVKLIATIPGDPDPLDITSTLGITATVNGNAVETTIAKPASGNEASVSWNRLPKVDGSNNPITYTVEETSVTMGGVTYTASSTPALEDLFTIDVTQPNASGNATITNTKVVGKITVTKHMKVDADADTNAADSKVWVGLFSDSEATNKLAQQEITITASGSGVAEFTDLTPGTYYVYELTGEDGTAVTSDDDVTINGTAYTVSYTGAGSTGIEISKTKLNTTATVTNTRPGKGKLTVTKSFDGSHTDALTQDQKNAITFTVAGVSHLTFTETKTYAEILALPEQKWVLDELDPGDYTVTEANANSNGYTLVTTYKVDDGDYGSADTVTLDVGDDKTLDIKNTYTPNPGSLQIKKDVTEGSAMAAADKSFTFNVVLTPANETVTLVPGNITVTGTGVEMGTADPASPAAGQAVTIPVTITGTGTATVGNIPAGTTYVVTETNVPSGWKNVGTVYSDDTNKVIGPGETADAVTITNTEITSISKTKAWAGGTWPADTTVTFTLRATIDGVSNYTIVDANGAAVTVNQPISNDTADHTATWSNLPKYYTDGTLIQYSVEETKVTIGTGADANEYTEDNLTARWSQSEAAGTITNTPTTTEISGSKVWADTGYEVANLPSGTTATIGLYTVSGGVYTPYSVGKNHLTVTLNGTSETDPESTGAYGYKSAAWVATFKNLRQYDDQGNEIIYAVKETGFSYKNNTYTVSADGSVNPAGWFTVSQDGNTITNTELTQISVEKTWGGGTWPEDVTVDVEWQGNPAPDTTDHSFDGEDTGYTTLSSSKQSATKTGLQKYADVSTENEETHETTTSRELITYSVKEVGIYYKGVTISENDILTYFDVTGPTLKTGTDTTYVIDNKPKTVQVEATKVWDVANGDGTSVKVQLYAGTTRIATATMDGIEDVETGTTDAKWTPIDASDATKGSYREDSAWHITFKDLPKYEVVDDPDHEGQKKFQEITYTVVESGFTAGGQEYTVTGTSPSFTVKIGDNAVDDFVVAITGTAGAGFTITNTERTKFEFTKEWYENFEMVAASWPTDDDGAYLPITVELTRRLKYGPSNALSAEKDSRYTVRIANLTPNSSFPITGTDYDGNTYKVMMESVSGKDYARKFTITGLAAKGAMPLTTEAEPTNGKWVYEIEETNVDSEYRVSYIAPEGGIAQQSGTTIHNEKSISFELPSTGGPGTTGFYVLGSILTLLALVLLITKKRSEGAGIE